MSQRKKDAYFFESVSAKCITNGEYELLEPLDFYEWLELIQNGTATDIAWVLVWCCILILNTIIGFKPCKRKETLN